MKPKIICRNCNYKPSHNEERSNDNWKVFNMKCPKCGKQMNIELIAKGGD